MRNTVISALAFVIAACAQIPPSPQEIEAKKFEPVPGKAVVYIVQSAVGPSFSAGIALDDGTQITTWTGTFYRWVTTPGTHRLVNTVPLSASITLQVEAGKIYFVEQWVTGWRGDVTNSRLEQVSDSTGREMVSSSSMIK